MMLHRILLAVYLSGFLGSYGHSYHAIGDPSWKPEQRAFIAFFIAAFWPLYATTTLQEKETND